MLDKIHEECGVFGIYTPTEDVDVVKQTYFALYALQHRGQQSCGIAVNDNGTIMSHKDAGLVPDVFNEMVLGHLKGGQMAVGHVRYGSSNGHIRENAQPLVSKYIKGTIALAYNGALVNAREIRDELQLSGAIFQTSTDAELLTYLIARERLNSGSIEESIRKTMGKIKGAYSIVIMSPQKLIAVRDPQGFRPLCMGKLDDKIIFASETCALDTIGAKYVRDVEPGEVIVVNHGDIKSYKIETKQKTGSCIFEHVYFARPDSIIDGASVHNARKEAGKYLAIEYPVDADLVCGVPDSGLDAALGYATQANIPYGVAFVKNRYVGRTFIQPTQDLRETAVKIKLNPLKSSVEGKRIILVDDSIVRGTTSANIIKLLRDAGATEVHMRISSPPFIHVCYFGTDIASRDKLIANRMTIDEICKHIGADSLGYLSVENLKKTPTGANCDFCVGCFTGKYPIEVPEELEKDPFERKLK